MKLYLQLLFGSCLFLLLHDVSAQAPANVYIVSTDTDNIICAGESITFIATPSTAPAGITYTYNFYRVVGTNSTKVNDNNNIDIIQGNRYTTTNTASNFRVKVEIVASSGAPDKRESSVLNISVLSTPTPKIVEQTTTGIRELAPQVLSTQPDIVLAARDINNNALAGNGFFSGEGVKKSGTNYIFSPSFVNAGRFIISYTYTHTNNCTKIALDTITVNANTGTIRDLEQSYCLNAGEESIGLGLQNITNRPEECYYQGTSFHYCQKLNTIYTLLDIRGKGVSGALGTGFTFSPQKAIDSGDQDTTQVIIEYISSNFYSYYFVSNPGNVMEYNRVEQTIIDTQKVALFTLDPLTITNSGQAFKPFYCRSENITLSGSPSSIVGKFSIKKPDGSTENNLSTPFAIPLNDNTRFPAGAYEITYTYTNPNGCRSEPKKITFTLQEVPATPFAGNLIYNYCVGDSIRPLEFIAGTGLITRWRKGDPNATPVAGNTFDPQVNNTFANSIIIYVTQANDACESATRTITITVSPKPEANFIYKNICQGSPTEFKNTTRSNGNTILKTIWDFGDGDILPEGAGIIPVGTHNGRTTGTYDNPKHTYLNADTYPVKLTLVTSACPDSLIKPVYIFPVQSSFPYIETFETGAGGWLAKSDTLTSWKLVQPGGTRITPDASSPNAWVTSNTSNSYNSPENSFVESPCLLLANTIKPYLSVNIRSDTEEGLDGAVLQYIIDDGNTFDDELAKEWKVLGNRNQGINWYNTSGIVSNPGGQSSSVPAVGWSGYVFNTTDTTKWVTANFDLSQVKLEAGGFPVRFRIAFSSNTDNPPNRIFDGFAFDNFIIGEINRIVLIEHFTNTSQPAFIAENQKIYDIIKDTDIASIQYHTSFPAADPINTQNTADPSARALLYSIAQTNRTVLDGISFEDKPFSDGQWGENAYSRRILFESPFTISVQLTGGENDPLKIESTIAKNNTLQDFNTPLIVQVAIVQKEVILETAVFQNVLRKLLPDAAGNRLSGLWKASDETRTEIITHTWLPSEAAAPNTYAVIVFIQDENTKEIYQTHQQLITIPLKADPSGDRNGFTTGLDHTEDKNIRISPNPASSNVHVSFASPIEKDVKLVLFDGLGKTVAAITITKGSSEYMLQTTHFPYGMYLIQMVSSEGIHVLRKKLLIKH